jgi:hypothetical protein
MRSGGVNPKSREEGIAGLPHTEKMPEWAHPLCNGIHAARRSRGENFAGHPLAVMLEARKTRRAAPAQPPITPELPRVLPSAREWVSCNVGPSTRLATSLTRLEFGYNVPFGTPLQ